MGSEVPHRCERIFIYSHELFHKNGIRSPSSTFYCNFSPKTADSSQVSAITFSTRNCGILTSGLSLTGSGLHFKMSSLMVLETMSTGNSYVSSRVGSGYLQEAISMVQIWSSRGYLFSSIMQEKVSFSLITN